MSQTFDPTTWPLANYNIPLSWSLANGAELLYRIGQPVLCAVSTDALDSSKRILCSIEALVPGAIQVIPQRYDEAVENPVAYIQVYLTDDGAEACRRAYDAKYTAGGRVR